MAYPELVALLDYKLARLQKARELLSHPGIADQLLTRVSPPSATPVTLSVEKPGPPMLTQSVTLPVAVSSPEPPPTAAQPVPHVVARARRFARRGPRKPSEALPSALRSAAPAGPVFVPAAHLQRSTPASSHAAAPPPAEPLTAALLARRWLTATS